jgi:DNA replication and repair protein RecF
VRLRTLRLAQFRNYASLSLALDDAPVHLFVGRNASGKTNLLDAVCILSQGQSSLGLPDRDLVQRGTEFFRIRGETASDGGEEETLEVVSQLAPRKQKACFRNDVRIPAAEAVGRLPTILFLPQDLSLFTGAPAERRRFIDQILIQVAPSYYRTLSEYQKTLRQRNVLLKRIAKREARPADLDPWDAALAEKGAFLTVGRLELLETFSLSLRDELAALGESWPEAEVRYERSGSQRETVPLAAELRALLGHAREKDVLLQATTVGPHRDDWHVVVDGAELERYASRGQQRAAVLALLFLESSFLELRRGEKPVILLDDILSELDDAHQERVLKAFPGHQVLLTATHAPKRGLEEAHLWDVESGTIKKAPSTKHRS